MPRVTILYLCLISQKEPCIDANKIPSLGASILNLSFDAMPTETANPTITGPAPPCVNLDDFDLWYQALRCPCDSKLTRSSNSLQSTNNAEAARQKRITEFATGRRCAETLLKRLGNSEQVWVNPDRSPAWPAGFVGSISHSNSWTWATVGRNTDVRSIGIDTEKVVSGETREEISQDIASKPEWNIADQIGLSAEQTFTLVFSAKEAFYKCCYPLTKQYFGFEHAFVESFSPGSLRITKAKSKSNPGFDELPISLDVHFLAMGNDIFTATWMEA